MEQVVFIGSHLGYPMEKTPLGGGAMVGMHLSRSWQSLGKEPLWVLGSGPVSPAVGIRYVRLGHEGSEGQALARLSEFEYARFCRRFEAATTEWILSRLSDLDPKQTCIVVNDISEGPTLWRLAQAGFPIVSLWHVDVVDYFNRLYLKDLVRPETLVGCYERLGRFAMAGSIGDLLRLVFEKQSQTVRYSRRMVFPSRAMAQTIERCYAPDNFSERATVIPWGVWPMNMAEAQVEARARDLRNHYQLGAQSLVLMTLSRISPEKGIHLLLEGLRLLEREGALPGDVCLFICGEPAFMRGASYLRQVRKAAARLKRVRVFFPGYLADLDKAAYFRLAHLFVSPSLHDSYGLNIVEAMQAGLAILASDHYGARDLLSESFGRKVRYGGLSRAPLLLAQALKILLLDRQRLLEMGLEAKRVAQTMPFDRAAEQVLEAALSQIRRRSVALAAP